MDGPVGGGVPARRRSRIVRTGARIVGIGAVLVCGPVAGLPTTGAGAVLPAAMPVAAASDVAAAELPAISDRAADREHAATVEQAQAAVDQAAAAQRAALQQGGKPRKATWADHLQVIAHRGGVVWGPESTLASFRHAIDVGSDAIEMDVRFTRDGVPMILHDDTLDRTTNCRGAVAAATLHQVKRCDAGSWYKPNPRPGERVPTLDEALAVIQRSSTKVYLHIKGASPAQARLIVGKVRGNDMDKGRVTYVSDWHDVLANLRAAGAQRLGYAFHEPSEWNSRYDVLIPQDFEIRRSDVAAAQRRGAFVAAVEGTPLNAGELGDLGLDGFMANNLDAVLKRVDKVQNPPETKEHEHGYGNDGTDGGNGQDGHDGKAGRGGDNWDPNTWDPNNWDGDDNWDPSDPDGPWAVGY